ncbi:putative membrane protein [Pseudoduganella lurida]|uniref:Putative membrane protein n=1 Tax=Pseudoduganella lurida TaxID=1036180 RepID=A0A562RIR2_9BURK|nr:DUF1700 domain-containing protein [Pseudoduganella lurida]TWI68965.1 putative membrane protein [Pseudoduganella lurida]
MSDWAAMNRQDYLGALERAMAGLPPATVAKTLGYYEQRFVDGVNAGRGEADIAAGLDDPRRIAMTLRANAHLESFARRRTPAGFGRMALSFLGLAMFNLFMIVPAAVFSALLLTVYVCSFSFYVGGIAVTASGLAGANEMVLAGPLHRWIDFSDEGDPSRIQTRVSIGSDGIHLSQESSPGLEEELAADGSRSGRLLDSAEAMADGNLRVSVDPEGASRVAQTMIGCGLVLGGIGLFLLSLVVTKYTMVGVRRYVQMNQSLLRGR